MPPGHAAVPFLERHPHLSVVSRVLWGYVAGRLVGVEAEAAMAAAPVGLREALGVHAPWVLTAAEWDR